MRRWREERQRYREWLAKLGTKGEPVFGIPDDYEFHYPENWRKLAMWIWERTGLFPHQDWIATLDPDWVTDLQFSEMLRAYEQNADPIMSQARQYWEARQAAGGEPLPIFNGAFITGDKGK